LAGAVGQEIDLERLLEINPGHTTGHRMRTDGRQINFNVTAAVRIQFRTPHAVRIDAHDVRQVGRG